MEKEADYLNHRMNCLVCKGCSGRLIFAFFFLFENKKGTEMLGQECVRRSLGGGGCKTHIKLKKKKLPEKAPCEGIVSH